MTDFIKNLCINYPYLIENPDCKDLIPYSGVLWKIAGNSYWNCPYCPFCGCLMEQPGGNLPFQCVNSHQIFISHITPLNIVEIMAELPSIK